MSRDFRLYCLKEIFRFPDARLYCLYRLFKFPDAGSLLAKSALTRISITANSTQPMSLLPWGDSFQPSESLKRSNSLPMTMPMPHNSEASEKRRSESSSSLSVHNWSEMSGVESCSHHQASSSCWPFPRLQEIDVTRHLADMAVRRSQMWCNFDLPTIRTLERCESLPARVWRESKDALPKSSIDCKLARTLSRPSGEQPLSTEIYRDKISL